MHCVNLHSVRLTILESTVSSPEMIAASFASDGDDELHKFRVLRDSFRADCDMLRVFFCVCVYALNDDDIVSSWLR